MTPTPQLAGLIDEVRARGWVSVQMPFESLTVQTADIGWLVVPVRRGSSEVSVLRPTSADDAPKRSLSAKYGTGAQPLHTDGAHLRHVPDIVALYSETRNLTPTLVWRPTESLPESVHEGVFTVDGGRGRFYASAWTESGYRYDPGCMTPADSRAREAAEFFEEARADAVEHRWETPGTLLLFDNRAVLHARAAVVENDGNREIRRVAFRRKEAFRR